MKTRYTINFTRQELADAIEALRFFVTETKHREPSFSTAPYAALRESLQLLFEERDVRVRVTWPDGRKTLYTREEYCALPTTPELMKSRAVLVEV